MSGALKDGWILIEERSEGSGKWIGIVVAKTSCDWWWWEDEFRDEGWV